MTHNKRPLFVNIILALLAIMVLWSIVNDRNRIYLGAGFSYYRDIKSVLFNMKLICRKSGINFYFRPSIPNSRVKAVAVKDKDGFIYIFVSDLFKCVENIWISFVHEIMHIRNRDYEKTNLIKEEDINENENYISGEAMIFFVGDVITQKELLSCNLETISSIVEKTGAPSNIVAEIVRFLTGKYNENSVNKLIHYYKSEEIDLNE